MKRSLRSSLLVTASLALLAGSSLAQERQRPMPPGIEDLPIGLSPEELGRLHEIGMNKALTPPPVGPARAAAEWDESIGVFCLWDNATLMAELAAQNDVYIITTNASWWQSWLSSNGIPGTNFKYLNAPTDTWWVRDYGPWFIWDGNQDFGLVDNIYNRPRPKDDVIPAAIANAYRVPYYGMDLIHTGGNYYADGYGNAWSTTLVYSENPSKTKAQVDQIMSDYLGLWRYVTEPLKYDIQHFDTFGKLLAPDTLVWGDFPDGTTPWAWSEGGLRDIQKLQSPYGWPYKIHRMPLYSQGSSWTAYINSLQTQDKIVMASYGTANDDAAKQIFEAAAPGYTVAKVAAQNTYWGDSVHCRTRNFIRGDAIRIYPRPHWEVTDDELNPYEVRAEVIPDNTLLLVGTPMLWWSVTGGPPFNGAPMLPTGNPHEYSGSIPAWSHGTLVSYYIEAQDTAGKVKRAPFVAPAGLFTIRVEQDDLPPTLEHDVVTSLAPAEWPPELVATALDVTGIPTLTVESRINGAAQPSVPMVQDVGTFVFRATLPGAAALGDLVSYRIVASDHASPPNATASPTSGWNWFRVENASRLLVVDLDPTPSSGDALAAWCDELALDVELTDAWPASLAGYDQLLVCLGMNPAHVSLSSSEANSLASFLNAGGAAWMEGGNAWAQSATSSIYNPFFGIQSASSGATLSGPLVGVSGEPTAGMSFAYGGETSSSDHLTPAAGAHALLTNGGQTKAVSYSTGTYRTVATSFEVSGLQDGAAPSRAKYLAGRLLDHLGAGVDLVASRDPLDPLRVTLDLEGDPGMICAIFSSPAPGYQSLGAAGVLTIDRAQSKVVLVQVLPASGALRVETLLPNDPTLWGTELYYQAYVRDASPSGFHLTNRDRITIAQP